MYYFNYLGKEMGWIKTRCFDARPIPDDVCKRVSRAIPNFGDDYLQVLIKFLGKFIWINVYKYDLVRE